MSVQFQFVGRSTPMGANLVAGGATFRTWAPRARSVCLLTGDALGQSATVGWTPDPADRLTPLGDGTWAGFLVGAAPGLHYLFWIDGEASQGPKRDPYARELTLTPAFPGSYCILRDPAAYPWHDEAWRPPDFSKLVIYQLHVSTWWAVDPTGADARASRGGRFLDVATRLDYLRDLGVNAIQLLPIQEFETEFSEGYNGVDYFSPEQRYQAGSDVDLAWYLGLINATLAGFGAGPLALDDLRPGVNQLKCLIDLAHLHGISVIFDLVYNHAGGGFDPQSLYFYDRFTDGDQNNSLYFTDEGWAGGLVFAYWNANVRQFLIDNASAFMKEYRIDGIRYDEVRVISNNRPSGVELCQDMTGTVRFIRPSAIQIAEYWDWDRAFPVTPSPAGLGFDFGARRRAPRFGAGPPGSGCGRGERSASARPSRCCFWPASGLRRDVAPRAMSREPRPDLFRPRRRGPRADARRSGRPAVLVCAQPQPRGCGASLRRARNPGSLHGPGDPRGSALVR